MLLNKLFFIITFFVISKNGIAQSETKKHQKDEYSIDGKMVTQEVFNRFLSPLKEIPNTWTCLEIVEDAITGYETRYQVTNEQKVVYNYSEFANSINRRYSLIKKYNDNPIIQKEEEYEINGTIVSKIEFNTLLATLKKIPNTEIICKKGLGGGSTGYKARDRKGRVYQYESSIEYGKYKFTLKKENR